LLPQNRDELLRKVRGYEAYRPTKPQPEAFVKLGLYRYGKSRGQSFTYQCAVCGADAEAFPVCAEGRDEVGPVRVCERCLEAGNIDEHLAKRATNLEARAITEQNAELVVEARDARSLIGRLDVPTIEAWRWLSSRDTAAKAIDIETCKVFWQYVQIMDPYGFDVAMPEEYDCVGRQNFVISDITDGKVWIGDLPEEKRDALHERMKREPPSSDDEIPF
jgi:hypothetical protein